MGVRGRGTPGTGNSKLRPSSLVWVLGRLREVTDPSIAPMPTALALKRRDLRH